MLQITVQFFYFIYCILVIGFLKWGICSVVVKVFFLAIIKVLFTLTIAIKHHHISVHLLIFTANISTMYYIS